MGRTLKPNITLNHLLVRYMEDIEAGHEERMANNNIEPREMFLIHTLLERESYPDQHAEAFEAFKRKFVKEKILKFPMLADFAKKYNFKWKTSDVMEYAQTGRNITVSFEKFFPVQVLDLKKLKNFRNKYSKTVSIKNDIPVAKQETRYLPKTKTLQKEGIPPHDFRTAKYQRDVETLRIFIPLWNNRHHVMQGKARVLKQGKPLNFKNFAMQAELAQGRDELTPKNIKKFQEKVRNVVKSLTRQGFPLSLECTTNRILLTVKD